MFCNLLITNYITFKKNELYEKKSFLFVGVGVFHVSCFL